MYPWSVSLSMCECVLVCVCAWYTYTWAQAHQHCVCVRKTDNIKCPFLSLCTSFSDSESSLKLKLGPQSATLAALKPQ